MPKCANDGQIVPRVELSGRGIKYFLLRYSPFEKGYQCYSQETQRYCMLVSVTFNEETSFFQDVSFVAQVLHVLLVEPLSFLPRDTQNQTTLQSYSTPRTSKSSSPSLITYHRRIQETGWMLHDEYSSSSPSPPSTNIMTPNKNIQDGPLLFEKVLSLPKILILYIIF